MPNREDILREQTYKEEMNTEQRVFYTLHDGEKNNSQAQRNSKAIAMIIKTLYARELITESDIDNILLECVS